MTTTLRNDIPDSRLHMSPKARNFLHACNEVYEGMIRLLSGMNPTSDPEAVLECVQWVAHFAWMSHTGRYADGALENIGLKIGSRLEALVHRKNLGAISRRIPPRRRDRYVLHVATTLYSVGGHSRLLLNWMKTDTSSQHSVLITGQGESPVPGGIVEAARESLGDVVTIPPFTPLLAQARCVRQCAAQDVDFVVLHHHPDDPTPTVSFATPNCPPVAIVNHADHVFWLGSGVADAVLNIRESGKSLSEVRRETRNNWVLPIPLSPVSVQDTRAHARAQLGIPESQVVLLSMGQAYKYASTSSANFFRTSSDILEANPEAHLYLIGMSAAMAERYAGERLHPRLYPLGIVEDPSLYQAAADVYLEGFPFGSLTALLEAARRGLPCVGAVAPGSSVLASDDPALTELLVVPATETAYVEQVTRMIRFPEERVRLGCAFRQSMESWHCTDGWRQKLERMYSDLGRLRHSFGPIRRTQFFAGEDDTALSSLQAVTFDSYQLLETLRRKLSRFLSAGLLATIKFSWLFRRIAWRQWYAELWGDLLKQWTILQLAAVDGLI